MDTNRATGQTRHMVQGQPLIAVGDLRHSQNIVDQLAGRLMSSKVAFDTFGTITNAHIVLTGSIRRVAIHFFGPNTGRVTLSNEPGLLIDNGITIDKSSGCVSLYAAIAGDVVTREWYAIGSAAGSVLSWIEVFAPENT